jgi:hypothetical protein
MSQQLDSLKFPIQLSCDNPDCGTTFVVGRDGLSKHEVDKKRLIRAVRTTIGADCPGCNMNVIAYHDESLPEVPDTVRVMREHCSDAYGEGAGPLEAIGYAKARVRLKH